MDVIINEKCNIISSIQRVGSEEQKIQMQSVCVFLPRRLGRFIFTAPEARRDPLFRPRIHSRHEFKSRRTRIEACRGVYARPYRCKFAIQYGVSEHENALAIVINPGYCLYFSTPSHTHGYNTIHICQAPGQ